MKDTHTYQQATCATCSALFMARTDSIKKGYGKYCSKSCQVKMQHKLGYLIHKAGAKSSQWRGGRTYNAEGYVLIYAPTHHRANCQRYVFEHILVAEKKLGRPILKTEVVHHLDKNIQNNTPENLCIMTRGKHTSSHHCKLTTQQAKEILASQLTQAKLAKKYNVDQTTISLIKTGKTYKHISPTLPPLLSSHTP